MTTLRTLSAGIACIFASAVLSADEAKTPELEKREHVLGWTELSSIPDKEGFAGSFAGSIGDTLVVAGGANFPDARPWEGGTKVWYDKVFVLEKDAKAWREAGKLPAASGYGLSLRLDNNSFLMIGGGDDKQNSKAVWKVSMDKGALKYEALPDIPVALAMLSGAIVETKTERTLYVAGGQITPDALKASDGFYRLNLKDPGKGWQELPACPGGGRILATGGVLDGTFYMFGGAKLVRGTDGKAAREWLKDAWSYHPDFGWKQLADMPNISVAAPTPAANMGQTHLLVLGGDDGSQLQATPAQHKGFPRTIMAYHTITDTWVNMGELPFSLVTTSLVPVKDGFVVTGGERQPGMRSTEVWKATIIKTKAAFGFWNYVALAGYLLAMVGIGWFCSRKNKSTEDYFKASGRIPWWAAGISIYATMLSSLTFMAIPAKAYATDWTFFWVNVPILLIAPLIIYLYLPFFRRLSITSAYEYLERRFNLPVRIYGSAAFILFQMGRQAIVLFLPSLALATVSDLDINTCIILMGVLCVAYTVMGGIEAVVWTDVVQVFLLIGAALVSLGIVIFSVNGAFTGFLSTAVEGDKFHMFNWDISPTAATNAFWVLLIGGIFNQIVPYTSDQAVVQRYLTTPDEKTTRSAIWMNAWLAIPSSILFFAIGTALFVFYKNFPEKLDPTQTTDSIFPAFIVQNLPIGIAGLVVAGIFAAAQSTVSGSLNSVVTAFMTDFYKRFGGKAEGKRELLLARVLTALLGVFATICALILASVDVTSIWDTYNSLVGLAVSGLAGLFALGIFTKRVSGIGALCGALGSAVVLYFVQSQTNLHFMLYSAVGMISCFVIGYVVSLMFPSKKDTKGLTLGTQLKRTD